MSLSKMLQEYREGSRCLPTYEELAKIAASVPMAPDRFAEKMDELDKANPAPLARLMASSDQCADPIVERVVSLLRQRSAVGVQKYGTTLADNKLPLRAWLNHALEEALDQANYLQAAMAEIDSATIPSEQDDAKDAARWRFMMASVDSEDSQEALLLKKLGNEDFTDDARESAQMTALVDAAIAAKDAPMPQ